jgi:hypothetical protein
LGRKASLAASKLDAKDAGIVEQWNSEILGRAISVVILLSPHHSNIPIFQTLFGVAGMREDTNKVLASLVGLKLSSYNFVITKNLKIRKKS